MNPVQENSPINHSFIRAECRKMSKVLNLFMKSTIMLPMPYVRKSIKMLTLKKKNEAYFEYRNGNVLFTVKCNENYQDNHIDSGLY